MFTPIGSAPRAMRSAIPRHGRTRPSLEGLAWSIAGASMLLYVAAGGLATVRDVASAVNAAGVATGLAGTALMLIMMLLAARVPVVDRAVGHGAAMRTHRRLGRPAFSLVVAHGTLLAFGMDKDPEASVVSAIQSMSGDSLLLAYASALLLVLVIVTSVVAVTRKLPYEVWHVVHLTTYVAMLAALPHQLTPDGLLANSPVQRTIWVVFYAVAFGSSAWFRLLVPVVRSLRHGMRVASVERITKDVVSIHLTGRELDRLAVEGGQFAVWRFWTAGTWWHAHPLSFSAMPTPTGARVTFRVVGHGTAALRRIPVGTPVWFEGPYGRFTRSAQVTGRVAIAVAGIGVTPIRALLEEGRYREGQATILLRATSEAETPLWGEVDELASAAGTTVIRMVGRRSNDAGTWMSAEAVEAGARIDTVFPDLADSDLYICGPSEWSRAVIRDARAAGVPSRQIHVEGFFSAQRGTGQVGDGAAADASR